VALGRSLWSSALVGLDMPRRGVGRSIVPPFPRIIGTAALVTHSTGLPPGRPRAGLSSLLSALLVVLLVAGLLPPTAAAQPVIDPAAIALTPADLPPGFVVVPGETRTEPLSGARGVTFRQILERAPTAENLYSGPIGVGQVILRIDEPLSFAGFLDYIRQEAITKDGYSLVPGAPNDGGTASLMKHEGDKAAFQVGFIKANMVVFTFWVGLASVVNLQGVLTLAGVSSARYDAVLAGLAPATVARPGAAPPLAPPPPPPPPLPPPPPSGPAQSAISPQVHSSLAPAWRSLMSLTGTSGQNDSLASLFQQIVNATGVRLTVGLLPTGHQPGPAQRRSAHPVDRARP
jgi:hypothetical protein